MENVAKEQGPLRHHAHGQSKTKEHRAWCALKFRATSLKDKASKYYALRGIRVCKEWATSFVSFFNAVGYAPTPNHSIDRIDNNGNYSCGKCSECMKNGWPMNIRWATPTEQAYNRRNLRKINHG